MRLEDCDMLDVYSEPQALNYRFRNRRTGNTVFLHVLPAAEKTVPRLTALVGELPQEARALILDHGRNGTLAWFLSAGLPGDEGFVAWLNRSTFGFGNGTAGAQKPAAAQSLRRIFERASVLPAEQRNTFVKSQCGDDRAMADRVLAMLKVGEEADGFLDVPAPERLLEEEVLDEADSGSGESSANDGPEFVPGLCVGNRYIIEGVVGRGGFGIIYRARDRQVHDRPVVLKVRRDDKASMDQDLMKRFRREVASLARITHPSVVGVLDVGQTERGTHYFVMPFVPGQTLRQKLRKEGPLPLPRIANIVQQISHALTVTHREGICHRDLKPENVMLQDLGDGEELAVIIDFGIATMKEGTQALAKTALTRVIGTRAYMPPEQLEGRPSAESDTYALGVMTWEMITGALPGTSHTSSALRRCPRNVRKKVGASLSRAMSPDLRLRHPRTREFGDEIFAVLQPPARRRRAYALDPITIAAVVCIIGLLWLVLTRLAAPAIGGSGIGYVYETRENPKTYRLHLSAQHPGTFYVLEETKARRFKILLPTLSYSGPPVRYLGVNSVEFPPKGWLGLDSLRPDDLWVIWSKTPVGDLEALARLQRTNPEVADAGLEAPATAALVERFRQTGGGQVSPEVAVQRVSLPAE